MINKDISVIPKGIYCYDENGKCPYWSKHPAHEEQEDGYCAFLERGDWEGDGGLLWDQVKECGVNSDWDEEDERYWEFERQNMDEEGT